MVAFQFRMGAGFAGDVNRTHPASIVPGLLDATNPPTNYGLALMINTAANSVRVVTPADYAAVDFYGVSVRPYPFQQSTAVLANAQANLGGMGIFAGQPLDVLESGFIMVPVVGTPTKGGQVFIWYAATSGVHTQGGFEAAATTVNLTTNGTTAAGNPTLNFASVPATIIPGMTIVDSTGGGLIPAGTTVLSTTATTVTMSANATGAGVGGTDAIVFTATLGVTANKTFFNCPPDANGIAELAFNI
jgi:hypothetical protein